MSHTCTVLAYRECHFIILVRGCADYTSACKCYTFISCGKRVSRSSREKGSGGEFFTISTRGCKFFTRCRFRTGFMNTVHCTVPAYSTAYSTVPYCTCVHCEILWKIVHYGKLICVRGLRSGAAFGAYDCWNACAKLAKIPVHCTGSVRTNLYFVNFVESCVVVIPTQVCAQVCIRCMCSKISV